MYVKRTAKRIGRKMQAAVTSILVLSAPLLSMQSSALEFELSPTSATETILVRVNGSVSYASNYHYRGIDLSQEDNVVQYALSVDQAMFGRVGVWTTEMDSPLLPTQSRHSHVFYNKDINLHRDYALGLGVARYHLNSDIGTDVYYTEWDLSFYYQNRFNWRTHYSERLYGFPSPAWVTDVEYTHPLTARVDVRVGAGYSYLEKSVPFNYANYLIGIDYALQNFLVEASYHRTTSSAKKLYGIHADNRFLLGVSLGF